MGGAMKRKIIAWMTALCFSFFALTLHVFAEETEVRVTDEDSGQPDDGAVPNLYGGFERSKINLCREEFLIFC
jgi:hypothetical protein